MINSLLYGEERLLVERINDKQTVRLDKAACFLGVRVSPDVLRQTRRGLF